MCILYMGDNMKIGYACICIHNEHTKYRTCIQKYATKDKLQELIQHNLQVLQTILLYNKQHGIAMYRLPSNIIPFGSSPINTLPWRTIFQEKFITIGKYIKNNKMRISMHPGQYTILNSPRDDVVKRSIEDLRYHASILDSMGLDSTHKLVLHIGGIYDHKVEAIQRFVNVYETLDDNIKKRLVIENDDRMFHMEDVLSISSLTQIPVIFDNLHHHILNPKTSDDEMYWVDKARKTWSLKDGIAKLHYCEQGETKRLGAHAKNLDTATFMSFIERLNMREVDIMLEVKSKNYSAIKCIQLLQGRISEEEKKRYQFLFYFDKSIQIHANACRFYKAIDAIYAQRFPLQYFQEVATYFYVQVNKELQDKDKKVFTKAYERFLNNQISWEKLLEMWYHFFWNRSMIFYTDMLYTLWDIQVLV